MTPGDALPKLELEVCTRHGPLPLPVCRWAFPDCRQLGPDGLVAIGADFRPETVVAAYRAGAFPWPHEAEEYLWFSPDPRAVLPLASHRVSRRLARTLRQGRFRVSVDKDFPSVIGRCATVHPETWITAALIEGYVELHRLGWAHSFEVWSEAGELVGGLYGVGVGRLFGAESMFHLRRDASKIAVAAMVQHAGDLGIRVVDLQVLNPHTESLGAVDIGRTQYLELAGAAMAMPLDWQAGAAPPSG